MKRGGVEERTPPPPPKQQHTGKCESAPLGQEDPLYQKQGRGSLTTDHREAHPLAYQQEDVQKMLERPYRLGGPPISLLRRHHR